MAGGFDVNAFEVLKRQVEELGLEEKQKKKFLLEEWKRICDAEERKQQAEIEERKRQDEIEERKRQDEIEERKRQADKEFELERLRLELEARRLEASTREGPSNGGERRNITSSARSPELPAFMDGKDDLDSYLLRFERYAVVAKWDKTAWATQLSALLSGKALDVYSRLSHEDALDYDKLKIALLKRYNYTEHGYRQRFREAKPEGQETSEQFIVRLRNYFTKWVELSEVENSYEGVVDLIVREQFANVCPKDLAVYLTERKPASLKELAELAEQYLVAHGKKLSSKDAYCKKDSNYGRNDTKKPDPTAKGNNVRCFSCQGIGHRAIDCPNQRSPWGSARQAPRERRRCHRCGSLSHSTEACFIRQQTRPQYRSNDEDGLGRNKHTVHHAGCALMMNSRMERDQAKRDRLQDREATQFDNDVRQCNSQFSLDEEWLELKSGEKLKVLNAACLEKASKGRMPIVTGMVKKTAVDVLRDTGCSGIIVKKALVDKGQMTGEYGYVMTVTRTVIKAPIARISIDTPYFTGEVEALCLEDPICDLIIGNISGAREPDKPDPGWCIKAAAVTRAQAKKSGAVKELKVPDVTNQLAISKTELVKLQEEDSSLQKYKGLRDSISKNGYTVSYLKRKGVWYRVREGNEDQKILKQILVPYELRKRVMEVAHDSILGGHMGIKKTEDRILTNFYWPGIHNDITRFCRSCDVCQKTVARGTATKVPLGKTPLIDMPFKRVAVDLIGPISPPSDDGHRYILTLVDYATRYPEAVPLKNIDTETVAEALMNLYSRLGVPEEVLSDLGTQFVSDCMQEVSRLLSIKRLTTTPYHPACNGLAEKFNGTLKRMLRRLCNEQPRQWHRYINPLLFAYREVPQESTGFSPFELLYGRTVRGPMKILKELWTDENGTPEIKTSYQYVLELRERLEDTMKLAQEQLSKNQGRYKRYYDRNAKDRHFKEGDQVLIMLPTDNNKLLMQWKGPYQVQKRIGENDYQISVRNKLKTYHANMLKLYHNREKENPQYHQEGVTVGASISVGEIGIEQGLDDSSSIDNDEMIELGNFHQTETSSDVKVGHELSDLQVNQLRQVIKNYSTLFSDLPGKTDIIEHRINLTEDEPIRCRPYPLAYAVREDLKKEIQEMLELKIIRTSNSPYASPIVIVKKKDGSNRICVDYRKLNKLTVADPEPMTTQEELFQKMGKSKYFSKIDLSKGYWQIPVAEEDIPKTAFITPDGTFECQRMPFGMKNSAATLVRGMRKILGGLENVGNYIDDIIVYTEDWQTHLDVLHEVLKRLRGAKLTVKPSKCILGTQSIDFLGHSVGEDWITPSGENLEKIENTRRPTTKKEVRSFFGLLNYYREYIPSFAAISAPLSDLTRKGQPNKINWGEAQEKAYQNLRKILLQKPILKLPNYEKQFIIRTDASNVGIGAVLLQDYDGKLHPVAFASKKLTKAEKNYSTIEKEGLAIVWGIRKFKLYLLGKPFILQTDHQPLSYLNKTKFQNDRVMRWALSLQSYDFRVEDIPGKVNYWADYLSRIIGD